MLAVQIIFLFTVDEEWWPSLPESSSPVYEAAGLCDKTMFSYHFQPISLTSSYVGTPREDLKAL